MASKVAWMKMGFLEWVNLLAATGLGLGLVAPFAPGTFGSAPGVALCYAMVGWSWWVQVAVCAGLVLVAIPICDRAERTLGIVDDGRITADEWMLFPIALVGIPIGELPWWSMVVFFCVVRAVDIVKPWPARGLQRLKGGLGIVVDDLVANLYSLGVNWCVYWLLWR